MAKAITVIKNIFSHIWKKVMQHKIISAVVAVLILGGGYYAFSNLSTASTQTRYVLAAAGKSTVVSSVSATGQVSALNQVSLVAKVSGDVVGVYVQDGQEVKAGTLIAQLDSSDAQKSVRDAEANLESAQLSLEKLETPVDQLSLTQAQNSLAQDNESEKQAETALTKAYGDGFTTISTVVLGESNLMTFFSNINPNQTNPSFGYTSVLNEYTQNVTDYQAAGRDSDPATLDSLLDETYNTVQAIGDGIKYANSSTYNTTINTYLSNLIIAKTAIQNAKSGVNDAKQSVIQQTLSLTKLQAGALPIDIKSQQLSIQQRQNALSDAKEKLAYYYITAPFDGFIVNLNVHKGDSVASIQSYGSIATIITKERIADVSLNEVDAAKIKAGQKATLTFDAFPDLTVAGSVAEIDAIGTVTQGVVDYGAKISFDASNNQIKPGMSVSAHIITDAHPDVISVPNSAVKSQNGTYYVQVLDGVKNDAANLISQGVVSGTAPQMKTVEIGLQNDSMTEITSGLNEGEMVVTRVITGTSSSTSTSSSATSRTTGIGGIGGGGALNALRATGGATGR